VEAHTAGFEELAQSSQIWRCGSDRKRSQPVSVFGGSGELWRSGRGSSKL